MSLGRDLPPSHPKGAVLNLRFVQNPFFPVIVGFAGLLWSPLAAAQWEPGVATGLTAVDTLHPLTGQVVLITADPQSTHLGWVAADVLVCSGGGLNQCLDDLDARSTVVLIDVPLDSANTDPADFRDTVRDVLYHVEDPAVFPVVPSLVIADLERQDVPLTSADVATLDGLEQIASTEITISAVPEVGAQAFIPDP